MKIIKYYYQLIEGEKALYEIELTKKHHIPALWVGGGARTNTFEGRVVLRKDYSLPRGLFIRRRGPLACEIFQALVPLKRGDYILRFEGEYRDLLEPEAEEVSGDFPALKVLDFHFEGDKAYAVVSLTRIALNKIPPKVREGLNVYHNRDGSYFVASI